MSSIRLTFDDGPGPSTARLLDVLHGSHVQATFFVLGMHAQTERHLLKRLAEEGHVVGNHTWAHARDGMLSNEQLQADIAATDALIRRAYADAGMAMPECIPLRLPYGTHAGDTRLSVLRGLGREHVGWTSLFDDWVTPAPDANRLAQAMRDHIDYQAAQQQDAVLCLHDSSPRGETREATVDAVERWLQLATR